MNSATEVCTDTRPVPCLRLPALPRHVRMPKTAIHARMQGTARLTSPGPSALPSHAGMPTSTPAMLQITANVLCTDGQIDPDVVAINAVSAALSISNIPWAGPLAAVRVTRTEMGSADGTLTAAPTLDDQRSSGLNLLYVGTADKALLVDFQVKCTGASFGLHWKCTF